MSTSLVIESRIVHAVAPTPTITPARALNWLGHDCHPCGSAGIDGLRIGLWFIRRRDSLQLIPRGTLTMVNLGDNDEPLARIRRPVGEVNGCTRAEDESLAAAALGDASDTMMAHPLALQLRNLQSLVEIGVDKNTTVIFPEPLMTTISELGSLLDRERQAAAALRATRPVRLSPVGHTIGLTLQKSSTRNRWGFDVVVHDHGVHVTCLNTDRSHIGGGESIPGTARNVEPIFDGVEFRGFAQSSSYTARSHGRTTAPISVNTCTDNSAWMAPTSVDRDYSGKKADCTPVTARHGQCRRWYQLT